ncbi:MAG TPA: hypothetical protein VHO25_03270 [Polyangiaceae bacterium]|nr:hypothetical protein [Polyangiaceae bacterium]
MDEAYLSFSPSARVWFTVPAMLWRVLGLVWLCLWASLGCAEEEPVSPEPATQAGCAGHNEAQCMAPCVAIKSRRPTSDDLEFMECVASELGAGATADTCGLSPDQSECRIFPSTRLAIGWRETVCNHPVCTGLDGGLDAGQDATVLTDASSVELPDSSALSDSAN